MKKINIKLSDHFSYFKLLRFVAPSVVMMVFTSIYGVVDGFFVSNYAGKTPFAAINLIMPVIMILGGLGFMIGTGGSAIVAKTLGEGEELRAKRYFTMMVTITVILGVILSTLGIVFIRPIASLLGAEGEILDYCAEYATVTLFFNTAFMLQNVFQSFFITAEKPRLGLAATLAAGFTNILLDYLFVGVMGKGVFGAALATGISQCVGGVLPLFYFASKNSSLLRFTKTRLEFKPIIKACANGSSELMSNISNSVVSMLFNFQLMRLAGENGVAAYGVLMYVQFVFIAIFFGYSMGSAPIVSYHFGAGNHAELKNMLKKSIVLMGCSGVVLTVAAIALAQPLASLFVGYDAELCDMTKQAFRCFACAFLLAGFNIFSSSFFTALNNGAISALISFLRTLVFETLCVLLLPQLFGLNGIWFSVAVAEVLACILSVSCLVAKRKKYNY